MTAPILPKTRLLALAFAGLMAATPALAHHPMGGMTPETLAQGLLSGLGHPVIGLDHLAALVGVGLVASRFARGLTLPAFWIVAMAAGVGLHLMSADLPYAETLVALSVVIIGLAATIRTTLPYALTALLFAAGGAVHGYALGESIIGAESTPLAAYLVGLVAVQTALTTGIAFLAQRFAKASLAASLQLRLAGLAVAAMGAATLVLSLQASA
ncbi:HupE/UreJ family protein [Microvirga arsenatis]|uniref:Urease accessory protein UreJ n=1 Tax=Microvirga arsenatis TaxID=2692265 RepID=A0ABW9YRS6_9HYPH|nr:HupE/UreJ family protein [Microvirga arsenatis]NBJ09889.1 urease accessory protein UreJ [Microvirga arsenatis]NBJ22957.1 urease accessory protein UreJ [Microvirga arsenatis]